MQALIFTKSVLGAGIRSTLEGLPGWSVREASTQATGEIVDLAQRCEPDITIFDMTCLHVLEMFQGLGKARVKLLGQLIVATMTGVDEETLFLLAMWGVAAHISARTEPRELDCILRRVTCGEYLLDSDCLRQSRVSTPRLHSAKASEERIIFKGEEPPAPRELLSLPSPLSPREADVLYCIAQGMTNKEIARALGITEHTIKNSVAAIFEKLQVHDRTSAVVWALRRKWIRMPEVSHPRVPRAAVA